MRLRSAMVLGLLSACDHVLGLHAVGSGHDAASTPDAPGPQCVTFNVATPIVLDPLLMNVSNLTIHDDLEHGLILGDYQNLGDSGPHPLLFDRTTSTWMNDVARDEFPTTYDLQGPIIDPTDSSADTTYIASPGSGGVVNALGDVEWTFANSVWNEGPTLHAGDVASSASFVPTGFGMLGSAKVIVEDAQMMNGGFALQLLVGSGSAWTVDTSSTETIDASSQLVLGGALTYDALTLVYALGSETVGTALYVSTRTGGDAVFPLGSPITMPASLDAEAQFDEPWLVGGDCSKLVIRAIDGGGNTSFYLLTP